MCVFSLEQKGAKFELTGDFRHTWVVYMDVWVVAVGVFPVLRFWLNDSMWNPFLEIEYLNEDFTCRPIPPGRTLCGCSKVLRFLFFFQKIKNDATRHG